MTEQAIDAIESGTVTAAPQKTPVCNWSPLEMVTRLTITLGVIAGILLALVIAVVYIDRRRDFDFRLQGGSTGFEVGFSAKSPPK